ncbi:hypothetical protein D9757_010143 [Collybiopsis confluens]|uniref:O-methyltransferase dimerisation domain-containing protein n=1 Tax=Collybiopsis confluens TaxID=2823264 RepID=A0A8H5GTG2_9AGAR|nr:hypothetical protein D9757_010143 [Collybiopsis confluens]
MEAQQKENVVTLGKLSELLDSIEQSAAVLRNALKTEHPRVEDDSGQDSAEIASSLNLPFHSSESVAIHASRLRVNSERLAQLATPPRHLVFEAAGSFYVTMALDVVTKADIATIIHKLSGKSGQEGVPVQVLAQESRLDGDLLARILRHLAVFGIFQEISLGNFANTPV